MTPDEKQTPTNKNAENRSEGNRHALCHIDSLEEGQSRGFVIKRENIADNVDFELFVVRYQNTVYAYRNRCPHLGIQLEWQPDQFLDADGCLIQCAMHGALFLIESGACIAGPCSGQALEKIECSIKDNHVEVWLA
ncbi:MAG: Rieske (2Fe-2S) protein [Oleibacter sp.]|nr:Rieske (2Fe-2S) protein [Thalassolituus sp.]